MVTKIKKTVFVTSKVISIALQLQLMSIGHLQTKALHVTVRMLCKGIIHPAFSGTVFQILCPVVLLTGTDRPPSLNVSFSYKTGNSTT